LTSSENLKKTCISYKTHTSDSSVIWRAIYVTML
jgi:hypothetical protein